MFTTPRRATLPIFTNYDSKPDTGTTLAIVATLTQFQHAITQFAAHYSELAAGAVVQPRPGVQPPPRNTPAQPQPTLRRHAAGSKPAGSNGSRLAVVGPAQQWQRQ